MGLIMMTLSCKSLIIETYYSKLRQQLDSKKNEMK